MSIEIVTVIKEGDNVAVANLPIMKGDVIPLSDHVITAKGEIPQNSMLTIVALKENDPLFCFGYPVARANKDILRGECISAYNCKPLEKEDEVLLRKTAAEKMKTALETNEANPSKIKLSMRSNGEKRGFRSTLVVLAPSDRMKEAASLFPDAVILETSKRDYALHHPNVHSLLHPFEAGESSDNEVYLADGDKEKAKEVYQDLAKRASETERCFMPASAVTIEIMGASRSRIVNEAVAAAVDRLSYLGATVIVDLEEENAEGACLIAERMGSKAQDAEFSAAFARTLATLRVSGDGKIEGYTKGGYAKGPGLWLNQECAPTLSNLVLNLSKKRENPPLAVALEMDEEAEDSVSMAEALLLSVTAAVR